MFGKKKEKKVKEPSPREIKRGNIATQVEQLAPGQSLVYRLPEFYWSGFAAFFIVDANPDYPQKGRRFIMSTDAVDGDKPAGKKRHLWDSDKVKDIAAWIADRDAELYS